MKDKYIKKGKLLIHSVNTQIRAACCENEEYKQNT